MEKPFAGEGQSPFNSPFQSQPGQPGGIKPFAAIDLAPPPASGAQLSAPGHGNGLPGPFMEGPFSGAFLSRDSGAPATSPSRPGDAFAPRAASIITISEDFPPGQPPVPSSNPVAAIPPSASTILPANLTPLPAAMSASPQVQATAYPGPSANPLAQAFTAPAAASPILQSPVEAPPAARKSQIIPASALIQYDKPPFFMTGTATIDKQTISEYLGLVSVEIVLPKDLLFRNPAPYGEMHRIKAAEDQLQKVKEKAMEELAERAKKLQADAVVGVAMQFSQFDAIVCLCSVVGTAVKLSD